jgi:transketolase C-terminal domain/subunit
MYTHTLAYCCPPAAAPQVIDLISLKPFDMETISKSVKKTRKALIVEECMKTGGIGASLSAVISESLFDELDHQVGGGGVWKHGDRGRMRGWRAGGFVKS